MGPFWNRLCLVKVLLPVWQRTSVILKNFPWEKKLQLFILSSWIRRLKICSGLAFASILTLWNHVWFIYTYTGKHLLKWFDEFCKNYFPFWVNIWNIFYHNEFTLIFPESVWRIPRITVFLRYSLIFFFRMDNLSWCKLPSTGDLSTYYKILLRTVDSSTITGLKLGSLTVQFNTFETLDKFLDLSEGEITVVVNFVVAITWILIVPISKSSINESCTIFVRARQESFPNCSFLLYQYLTSFPILFI